MRIIISSLGIALCGGLIISEPASAAVNVLTNGGFETGNFSGWSLTSGPSDNSAPVVIAYGQASGYPTGAFGEAVPAPAGGGKYFAYFSADNTTETLSQSFTAPTTGEYTFGFSFYAPANGLANPGSATITGTTGSSAALVGSTMGFVPANGWVNESETVFLTASDTYTTSFSFVAPTNGTNGTSADIGLDKIFVQAVPEPATWGTLLIGFAGMGFIAYRRNKKNSTGVALMGV